MNYSSHPCVLQFNPLYPSWFYYLSMVTWLRAAQLGVRIPAVKSIFSPPRHPDRLLWTPQPSYSMGTWIVPPAGKAATTGIGHSPPCSAEVNNEWSNRSTPPICFYGVARCNFNFLSTDYSPNQFLPFHSSPLKMSKYFHCSATYCNTLFQGNLCSQTRSSHRLNLNANNGTQLQIRTCGKNCAPLGSYAAYCGNTFRFGTTYGSRNVGKKLPLHASW
jgi:hypothetical protein